MWRSGLSLQDSNPLDQIGNADQLLEFLDMPACY